MKPVVVFGTTGMLGSMVTNELSKSIPVVAVNRAQFDVTHYSPKELECILDGVEWAVNCIGIIPQKERDRVWMYAVNTIWPEALNDVCAKTGTHVIQIATDCAFDGRRGMRLECDKPDAHDDYGKTKAMGEVKSEYFHHIRCSVVGPETHGKSLLGWFLSQPNNAIVDGYANQFWNGVTTLAFAKVCRVAIEGKFELPWMHHLIPKDSVNKAQLLRMFAECYRPDIKVNYVFDHPEKDMTLGTLNIRLNKEMWKAAGYSKVPEIKDLIREMAHECGIHIPIIQKIDKWLRDEYGNDDWH